MSIVPDIRAIDSEITSGLKNDKARLDCALRNLDYFEGNFDAYPVRPPGSSYDAARYRRNSRLMSRVIEVLTANLYAADVGRRLPEHPQAEAWLAAIYKRNAADALWQEADRMSGVGQVAAFKAEAHDDPACPVKLHVLDAAQFCVWLDPDDPRCPIAVAEIDVFDNRRRLRLWTTEVLRTYRSDKLGPGQTAGATMYKYVSEDANPYGIIPFSFAHWRFPARYFWSGGPGDNLQNVNDWANFFLTEQADCIRYNTRPVVLAENVLPGWRPPSPIQPGDVWQIPFDGDAAGAGAEARVSYLQADVSFIGAGWDDAQAYIDHTLEMDGVPPGTIRMKASAEAGIAIVAEQIPLILWARRRQRPFAFYELNLAKLVLAIGATHLGSQADRAYRATSAQLAAAALDPGLTLRWPDMFPDLPGPDRDQADSFELENGLSSRIEVLMRRRQLTRDEAIEALQQIAADRQLEQALLGPTEPEPAAPPADDPESETESDPGTEDDDDDGRDDETDVDDDEA